MEYHYRERQIHTMKILDTPHICLYITLLLPLPSEDYVNPTNPADMPLFS
jgi:hypothetical protein